MEMECATLFTLGLLRRFRTASILVVSDSLAYKTRKAMVLADSLTASVEKAARILFDAITKEET